MSDRVYLGNGRIYVEMLGGPKPLKQCLNCKKPMIDDARCCSSWCQEQWDKAMSNITRSGWSISLKKFWEE